MIKYYCCLLLFLVIVSNAEAQTFAIKAERMNVAYIGIDNPLTIVSGKCGCNELVVTIGGEPLQKAEPCKYIYRPSKEGKVDVVVAQKTNRGIKILDTQQLRVKFMPQPIGTVGGKKSGYTFPVNEFKVQSGISVLMEGYDGETWYIVEHFTFNVIRKGILWRSQDIRGPYFGNKECKALMAELLPGDIVQLETISMICPSCRARSLPPLTYTMK